MYLISSCSILKEAVTVEIDDWWWLWWWPFDVDAGIWGVVVVVGVDICVVVGVVFVVVLGVLFVVIVVVVDVGVVGVVVVIVVAEEVLGVCCGGMVGSCLWWWWWLEEVAVSVGLEREVCDGVALVTGDWNLRVLDDADDDDDDVCDDNRDVVGTFVLMLRVSRGSRWWPLSSGWDLSIIWGDELDEDDDDEEFVEEDVDEEEDAVDLSEPLAVVVWVDDNDFLSFFVF